jgi:hypothetical protein
LIAPLLAFPMGSCSTRYMGRPRRPARKLTTPLHYDAGPLRHPAREKRAFQPRDPERVTLYVCGPTVYDYRPHRQCAAAGGVRRAGAAAAPDLRPDAVVYARNVTDVDDKINAKAAREGKLPIGEDAITRPATRPPIWPT